MEVTSADYHSSAVQELWGVLIPMVDIFERNPGELTFRYFRLDPEALAGREEVRRGG